MLLAIRDRATGWIAWIIVILLIIPFALWGIQEYVGGGSEPVVAEVNGVEITRNSLTEQTERVLRTLPDQPEGEELDAFRRRVLEGMVTEQALIDAARAQGMRIPAAQVDASVLAVPAFQADGRFSQEAYLRALANARLTPERFWHEQRRELLREQLLQGIGASAFATAHDVSAFIRLRDRTLELSYGILRLDDFIDQVEVSDEQVQAHYDANSARYTTPARVKLAYLKLDVAELEETIPVSEEQVRALFEERESGLFQPEERAVAHILIAVPAGASAEEVEAARQQAQGLRERIAAGEEFAALAREHSDDAESAARGGDLGVLEPGSRDLDFELAVAELAEGEVSQPVRTPQGFEIIKLTRHTPARRPTLEDVRERLAQEYRRQEAETLFYERSETLLDLTYENPMTLEVAANALGLEVQHTGWLTPEGSESGLGSDPQVVRAAFSDEVLAGGNLDDAVNSHLIELGAGEQGQLRPVVVIRPVQYEPPHLRPLEEVHGEIRATLRREQAGALARQKADELLQALRDGGDFEASVDGVAASVELDVSVGRRDSGHPPALLDAAFALGKPEADEPIFGTAVLPSGDVAVLAVSDVIDGDPDAVPEHERQAVAQLVQRMQALAEAQSLIEAVRARADVTINDRALARSAD